MKLSRWPARTAGGVAIAVFAVTALACHASYAQSEFGECKVFGHLTSCSGSNLSGADLRGEAVAMGDFSKANLSNANLEDLDLWKTDLHGADLHGAKIRRAFLTGADLRGANLQGADLREAFLYRAQAEGANFEQAVLDGARWITGAICGPGSVGECRPLPPTADYSPPAMTWLFGGEAAAPKAATGPIVTEVTSVADMPKPVKSGSYEVGWTTVKGLHVEVLAADAVVSGQPSLKLTAVPTDGTHAVAAQIANLAGGQTYRVILWVKSDSGARARVGLNYEGAQRVSVVSFDIAHQGVKGWTRPDLQPTVEGGPDGWVRLGFDASLTKAADLSLTIELADATGASNFKGDGRLDLILGGIEVHSHE